MARSLYELQLEARKTAVAHGFDNASFGERIALIHSELSEALEEWRSPVGPGTWERYADDGKPEGIASELADVIIRTLDMAAAYGVDMSYAVEVKMAYNTKRPFRHGGKKL